MKTLLLLAPLALACLMRAEPVNIKIATILPPGTSGEQRLQELRMDWQASAPQAVKLTVLGGSPDTESILVKKMRNGGIQAALISAVGLGEIDRSVTCLQIMPMVFRDWREVDYVREKIRGDLEARLREKGFEVLFWADAGWVRFFATKPAVRPADFKPMKMFVWSGEPHQLTIMRSMGYQPVGLEPEQILPQLQSGMINAVPVPPFLANALQYSRYVRHMVDVKWVPIVGAAVVDRAVWEKIPAEARATLLKSAAAIGEKIRALNREEDENSITALAKRVTVHTPDAAALAEWRATAAQAYPQIRGKIVPAELFDQVMKHAEEFRATAGTASP